MLNMLNVGSASPRLREENHARNARRRALSTTAEWSYDNLARAVNNAGADTGLRLRYDRTAVAHWLSEAVRAWTSRRLSGRPVR